MPRSFDPIEYFGAIPARYTADLEDNGIDEMIARELFMGEYEISFTKETSEISKRDMEAVYFHPTMNFLNDEFIQNFDNFQVKHPQLSKKMRSQTEDLVGFSN